MFEPDWICLRCGECEISPIVNQCRNCGWIRPGKITDDSNLETVRKLREWYLGNFYPDAQNHDYHNWCYEGSPRDLYGDIKNIVEPTSQVESK